MVIDLGFSNFYSFASEVYLSFEMGKKPARSNYDIQLDDGRRLNKVLTVIGPNGSGKTQFIKPLAFLNWFMSLSFLHSDPEAKLPYRTHALCEDEPTTFRLRFALNGEQYKYSLVLKDRLVVSEGLYHKTSHLYSYLFVREFEEVAPGKFEVSYKQQNFSFSPKQAKEIRRNASLLAAAYSYDVPEAQSLLHFVHSINHNLNVFGRHHYDDGDLLQTAEDLVENDELLTQLAEYLADLDLGLQNVEIRKETFFERESGEQKEIAIPYGIHESDEGRFELRFMEESSGTKSAFVLLARLLPVLTKGGVAVIDEIDNDLHPHMLPHILNLFKSSETNPHNAQIIFSCHTPEILNLLQKHQIYLVEKKDLKSDVWRLDDVVGLRADDNLYARYMAGALEAVPNL